MCRKRLEKFVSVLLTVLLVVSGINATSFSAFADNREPTLVVTNITSDTSEYDYVGANLLKFELDFSDSDKKFKAADNFSLESPVYDLLDYQIQNITDNTITGEAIIAMNSEKANAYSTTPAEDIPVQLIVTSSGDTEQHVESNIVQIDNSEQDVNWLAQVVEEYSISNYKPMYISAKQEMLGRVTLKDHQDNLGALTEATYNQEGNIELKDNIITLSVQNVTNQEYTDNLIVAFYTSETETEVVKTVAIPVYTYTHQYDSNTTLTTTLTAGTYNMDQTATAVLTINPELYAGQSNLVNKSNYVITETTESTADQLVTTSTLATAGRGTYSGTLEYTDVYGTVTTLELPTVIIDDVAPTIASITRAPGNNLGRGPEVYTIVVTDDTLLSTDNALVIKGDNYVNSNATIEGPVITDDGKKATYTVTVDKPGTYEPITVEISDSAGNKTTKQAEDNTFIITDGTAGLTSNAKGGLYNTDQEFKIIVTAEDLLFNQDGLTLEPEVYTVGEWTQESPTVHSVTVKPTAKAGETKVYPEVNVSYTNAIGEVSELTIPSYTIDKKAPIITISERTPAEQGVNDIINSEVTYQVTVTDDIAIADTLTADGYKVELVNKSEDNLSATYTLTRTEEGEGKPPVVKTEDKAGNTAEATGEGNPFIIDTTNPEISVKFLCGDTTQAKPCKEFTNQAVTIEVTAKDNNKAQEDNHLDVKGLPSGGQVTSKHLTAFDNEANSVTFTVVIDNIDDNSDIDYDSVYFEVSDLVGNTSTSVVVPKFTIDKIKPVVKFTEDSPSEVTAYPEDQLVKVEVTDRNISLTKNSDFTANLEVLNVANNVISLTTNGQGLYQPKISGIKDKAGNIADEISYQASFRIDTEAPGIQVEQPENYYIGGDTYKVTATITDDDLDANSAIIKDNGKQLTSADYKVNEDGKYVITVKGEGTHNITISAKDKAGNTAEWPKVENNGMHVLDATAPEIIIDDSQVNESAVYATDKTFTVTIKDKNISWDGIVINGGSWNSQTTTDDGLQGTVAFTEEGKHQIQVSATDLAGNQAMPISSKSFKIDKTAPVLAVTTYPNPYNKTEAVYNIEITDENITADLVQASEGKLSLTRSGNKLIGTLTLTGEGSHTPTITFSDLAGNQGQTFTSAPVIIDATAPVVKLEPVKGYTNGKYLNTDQEFILTITDLSFDSSRVKVSDGTITGWTNEDLTHTARVIITSEGSHTLSVNANDIVGNTAGQVTANEFVIDKTNPQFKVTTASPLTNGKYANTSVSYKVTIDDANFDPSTLKVANGQATNWTKTVTGWQGVINLTTDGRHQLTISGADLAGNAGNTITTDEIIIDTVKPEINILNVTNGQVFTGSIKPGASYTDANIDPRAIRAILEGPNGKTELTGDNASLFFEDIEKLRANDGIYKLIVYATDLAGNESSKQIEFALNRFGSAFAGGAFEYKGKYLQGLTEDLHFTETSLVPITNQKLRVIKNGEILDVDELTIVKATEKDGYYLYEYTIPKEYFKDGNYQITVITTDENGYESSSGNSSLNFIVDTTKPVIHFNTEDNAVYAETEKNVIITVDEQFGLSNFKVYVNDKLVEAEDAGNNSYVIKLASSDAQQNIKVLATDKAGNSTEAEQTIIVSTNPLTKLSHSKLFGGLLTGGILTLLALLGIVLFKRKKRDDERLEAMSTGDITGETKTI